MNKILCSVIKNEDRVFQLKKPQNYGAAIFISIKFILGSHERIGLWKGETVEVRASDQKVIGYYKKLARKMYIFPFPLFSLFIVFIVQ